MGGVRFIYEPERRLIARCSAHGCGCFWLNLWFGCVRIWPLRDVCWGTWLSRPIAGLVLRGNQSEQHIGTVNVKS